MYKSIDLDKLTTQQVHGYLLGAIGPRPIALVSSIHPDGSINLSPFSFFNVFSANPPMLIFSPARRVRDNTTKHTLENALKSKEVVVNVVNYAMVEQMSLSSTEYDKGVNEFEKAGLTPMASDTVKPPRVAEAPVSLECMVKAVVPLGDQGGAGNLVMGEVKKMHIQETVLDDKGKIEQTKIDLVARMGGDWYCRAYGDALFEVKKPLTSKGIGIDSLPIEVQNSKILTGNDLGKLGNLEASAVQTDNHSFDLSKEETAIHQEAKRYLEQDQRQKALNLLMAYHNR